MQEGKMVSVGVREAGGSEDTESTSLFGYRSADDTTQ